MIAGITYGQIYGAKKEDGLLLIGDSFEISLLRTQFNALKIIAIFFWKQAYSSFKWRGKKCVLIRYLPYVTWKKITTKMPVTSTSTVICTPTSIEMEKKMEDVDEIEPEMMNTRNISESISLYDPDEIIYQDSYRL